MSRTWKYFDFLIVIGALIIGFGVWFIPNFKESDEMQELFKVQIERKEARAAREAEQARIAKEREDLGIVYIPPPVEAEGGGESQ